MIKQNTDSRKSWLLYLFLFSSMFLFGYVENIKGVSFPLIKAEFDISYAIQGAMVSSMSFGYTLFCLVGGILIGKFGVKNALTAGYIFLVFGLIGVFFMPRFLLVAATLFLLAAGFGFLSVGLNALAAQVFSTRAALLLSLLHFFYGAGSSISPRAAGVLATSFDWRYAYLLSVVLVLVLFIPSLFAGFPKVEDKETKKAGFLTAFKTPMVWVFSITLGISVVVEMWSPNWSGLYFQDMYHLDPKTSGAAYISNFFILFTVSRLVSGFAIEKIGYIQSLFIAAAAMLIIFILGFMLGAKSIYVLPIIGYFCAILWPTILATAMGYFRKDAPIMISAMIVISGAFNASMQFLIGMINRLAGPVWSYRGCIFFTLLLLASLTVLARRLRLSYKGTPE